MSDPEKSSPQVPKPLFTGTCACGRITYTSASLPTRPQTCHCTTCRRLSGGSSQSFADIPAASLTYYDNREHLRYEGLPRDSIGGIAFLRFSGIAERAFCRDCWAPLGMRYRRSERTVWVALGSVDERSISGEEVNVALRPTAHIFAAEKAWWVELGKDGLPVYEEFIPE